MSAPETWFVIEIEAGIQRLCRNGLQFRPLTAEDQEERRNAWTETLWPDRRWDEQQDTQRIRKTFKDLCVYCQDFPTPRDFDVTLRDTPREFLIDHHKQPIKEMTPEQHQEVKARIAVGLKKLRAALEIKENQKTG